MFLPLITMAISLLQDTMFCSSNKIAACSSIIIGTGCVIAAPFLYRWTPTVYEVLMTVIAGIFQE